MTTTVKLPDECSIEEIDNFCELVRKGEEVDPKGLTNQVKRAAALVFLYAGNDLRGVAALKKPNVAYKAGVFQKAAATVPTKEFALELGWVYLAPQHRRKGRSCDQVEAALNSAEKQMVFATSRTDDEAMHRTLLKSAFSKEGKPYRSGMGEHSLELFVLRQ